MAFKKSESKVGKYANVEGWNKKGKLREGDSLEGYLIDVEKFNTKFGEAVVYIIEKEDSSLIKVIGQTDIRNKFDDIAEKVGDNGLKGLKVRFTYTGVTETTNGMMKTYDVEYDEDDHKEIK